MEENNSEKIYYIPVEDILPNRFQPRLAFDEKELNDLANSIIKYGVIQPIVLRKISDKYEIIAGERRYKAACLAGLKKIPAIINNTDDNTSAEIALLENLQRKNLTVIEEAQSYKKLIDKGFTQEDIANKLSVSQSSIANKLRLLNLPKEVRDALLYNKISERHARTLLSLNNEDLQKSLLQRIIDERLTVKQTEEEVSMIIMKNDFAKRPQEVPDEIKRFLTTVNSDKVETNKTETNKTDTIVPKDVDEVLDFKVPNVINITPNETKENKNVNKEELNLDDKNDSIFKESISYDEGISPFLLPGDSVIQNVDLTQKEEVKSENKNENSQLPVENKKYVENINNVKRTITTLNNIKGVTTREVDLEDKYQIIIEIDKSTN